MSLPSITPAYAPQPADVAWPTNEWPRGEIAHQEQLVAVADEAFSRPELARTFGVVVIRGGRVLYERYGDVIEHFDREPEPVTADTSLLSWSMAKSMLHFIVGTLVEQGRLDPDAPAPVPEWTGENDPRRTIRLADLLAMRDGLDFSEVYSVDQPSHVVDMLFGIGQADVSRYAADRPLAHRPDTVYNYSSGTTNIISGVVADVLGAGDPYRAYLKDRLFDPLGMTHATPTFDESGVWIASSYVHAPALEFAKFGLLYLRGGEWEGRRLVPQSWCDTAQIPRSHDPDNGHYYGWQWWITDDRYGTYWASGYEGQRIYVVPALDALVLRFGRTDAEHYPDIEAWRGRVLDVLASP